MQFRLFILISLISILSITGLYAYAATLDIVPVGEVEDSGSIELKGPMDAAIATIDGKTYVIVSAGGDDGMEIIDISDPSSPTSVGRVVDGTDTGRCTVANGEKCLDNANGNAITTIDGSTYAIIVGTLDDGIEIIDISDPTSPTSVGRLGDTGTNDEEDSSRCTVANGERCLNGAKEVGIYTRSGSTYAVVTASTDDGIEIIDISDPTNPTSVGRLGEADDTSRELDGAKGIAIETINGTPYAIVGSLTDDGIEIIDISDPTSPTSVGRMDDGTDTGRCTVANGEKCLDQAKGVRTTTINDKTYVIVSGQEDDGIEIIDISDPTNPTSVSRVVDGADSGKCTVANGEKCLEGVRQIAIAEIGEIGATSGTYYVITAGRDDNGIDVIDISDPENPSYLGSLTDDDSNCSTDGDGGCELDGPSYIAPITSIGTSTYVVVTGQDDNGIQIIRLCENCEIIGTTPSSTASTSASSSICARHVILGNCGTIAINNDAYRIIDPWSTIPTTEVMVGEPVTITLSTPHNYAAAKINSASIYTEIFGSPANYEFGSHIDYSVMKSDYYVSESELFQVAGATHRINQDTNVKNLKLFEVVFTMVFAKPMDTSHVVVETKNVHGIPETLYLMNVLKVIERPIELLTFEEKSKFKIIYEPELKASLRPDIDIEPDMDMLAVDPEPVVSKVTCGNGTMLKDNLCVPNEMSFYFFVHQFMRLFG
jgi:hypothetical protein